MLFSNIAYIDENFEAHENCYVGTIDKRIEYIGKNKPKEQDIKKYGRIYDGQNKLLCPGFYNAHAHASMVLLRSRGDDMPLSEWLEKNNFPFEALMTAEDNYWATLLAFAEMSRFGIASCSDMYFYGMDRCRAAEEAKFKYNCCEVLFSWEDSHFKDHEMYNDILDTLKYYHNSCDERIKIDIGLHSEYGTKEMFCIEASDFAKKNDLIMHIHVSETEKEHLECMRRHGGKTPTQYLDSIGVFDGKTNAVHGVWLTERDMDILGDRRATVTDCPASNLKLGSGIPDIGTMRKHNINVAIGTDGVSSSNNHNFLQAIYLTSMVAKGVNQDPTIATSKDILYNATKAGAYAQGRKHCGLIKKGYMADLCVFDMSGLHWQPKTDIVNNLVYAGVGTDVVLTMCDGEVIYEDGNWPFIDIEKVKFEVNKSKKRIIRELAK